jgi:hypothetical protein
MNQQLFHHSMNYIAKGSIVAVGLIVGLIGAGWFVFVQSPFVTNVGVAVQQPIPFSHEHHVRGLGLDCRYCHTSVEEAAFAGIPPTETCMTCHSQVWTDAPMLEPARTSFQTGESLEWVRVHDLADYVYFNHSAHINVGIGCESCHGRVDKMPLMSKANTLRMSWCLDCHRAPENFIRPQEEVVTMGWVPPIPQSELGPQLVAEQHIDVKRLEDCSICHR